VSAYPKGVRRIAVTGGPGAGKTTIWRALAARHPERVVAVSEVATMMFQHLFPAVADAVDRELVQRTIFETQRNVEAVYERRLQQGQVLLCDRGTPDGAGYWPGGCEAFFEAMQTRWEHELARYEAVLFLETAAAGGLSIAEGNPIRSEALDAAVAIDRRLHEVWSRHPRFQLVEHQREWPDKLALGTAALAGLLDPGAG
jgi:predicted ATPase